MLEIGMNDVTKNFGFKNVLDGFGCEIMTGDRVALVGRNGTGKSTILKIIAGQEHADRGIVTVRRGATVGYLEQIPSLSTSDASARELLMEPFSAILEAERRLRDLERAMAEETDPTELERCIKRYAAAQDRFAQMGGYDIEEKLSRVVGGFGLEAIVDRPFNVLSGGQKTIVMLACALLREPDILLLDEPTNHLDMRTLEWFEGFLAKYRGTVVMVSHDRYFLDQVATKTLILESGTATSYPGNYSFSVKERERQLLIEFEAYKNQQKKIDAMKAAIKRYREWGAQGNNEMLFRKAKELEKRLEKLELLDRPQLEKPLIPIGFSGERTGREVVRLADLSLTIGGLRLLEGVTLKVFYRDRAALLGDNGTGKTTLIRAILGEHAGYAGELFLAPTARVGYIPQEIRFGDDKVSVLDEFRREHVCTEGEARNILARYFLFGNDVFKRVSALSGGEKVLLKLAVLVQRRINFLILDEPTNHIDIETREMLEEALLDFSGTILFVSHDRYFIGRMATRILTLEDRGIAVYEGDYEVFRRERGR